MPESTAIPAFRSARPKTVFWIFLFLLGLWVFLTSDMPLLHTGTMYDEYRAKLIHDRLLLFPHILGGTLAMLTGPLQFSSRLRRRNLQLHRILGRVYVFSVLIAAPIAIILSIGGTLLVATWVQAGCWFVCTLSAFLTARNGFIAQHREWMVRSYAMTFTFILFRIPNPWPAYWNMSDRTASNSIIILSLMAVFLPSFAFHWHALTTRKNSLI